MLEKQIKRVLDHVEQMEPQLKFNRDLVDILEGQLLPFVEAQLKAELSVEAYNRAKGRIPPVNILQKMISKLSQLYNESVERTTEEDSDKETMAEIVETSTLDEQMQFANRMWNLNKYVALEPYVVDGQIKIRVIPANQFTVLSDDLVEPTNPTIFVKFMGIETDVDGKEVSIYFIYSAEEFLAIDSNNVVRYDLMGENQGVNPFGVLPFVYISTSKVDLIPVPSADTFAMTVLLPTLLADLNYAIQFMSHSILYGIDVDAQNLKGNPDAFWDLKSIPGENSNPSIGAIKPEVDIDQVSKYTKQLMADWFDMRGVKTSTNGQANESATSGIAKMIDNADTTEARRAQINIFTSAEKNLWELLSIMLPVWLRTGEVEGLKVFSTDFQMNIEYAELKPIVDMKAELEKIKMKLDLGLTSFDRALRAANPNLDDTEIENLKKEIEAETGLKAKEIEESFLSLEEEEEDGQEG